MASIGVAAAGGAAAAELGTSDHTRRLSDKILAAFNHAYSVGEVDIARRLHAALALVEVRSRAEHPERRTADALDEADSWVAFVEARNSYHAARERDEPGGAEEAAALEAMKQAYRRWSAR